jgi:hypothetical protein
MVATDSIKRLVDFRRRQREHVHILGDGIAAEVLS